MFKTHLDTIRSMATMGTRGQGGPIQGMLFLAVATILVSIVAIVYNGIDKTTLIGGALSIGNLIPLVAVSGAVIGGLVILLLGVFRR